ncbi:hypothetical protein AAHH79_40090, partial [Burkholderia pseudomallei]
KLNPRSAAGIIILNAPNPHTNNAPRAVMMGMGYNAQRFANDVLKKVAQKQTAHPPSTTVKRPAVEQVIHFVNTKMPRNL